MLNKCHSHKQRVSGKARVMNHLKSKIVLLLFGLAVLTALFPACTSDRPVGPGSTTNFAPQNCSGVLGNNTIESTSPGPADVLFVFVVPGSNTTMTSLSVYTTGSVPVTYEAGVYSNAVTTSGSLPGTLLVETGLQTVSAPATMWNTAALSHNINLAAGVTYWLAFQSSGYMYGPTGSGAAFGYQTAGAFGSLPATFSGSVQSSPTFAFSIYGTTCP
jgi:hypothetical protein